MRTIKMFSLAILLIFIAFENGYTQQPQSKSFTTKENVAIGGNDLVAYFTQNKAVRGSQKFFARHHGVDYWFSSSENKSKFQVDPGKYLPQYGGYCAFAMAMKNAKVQSDPKTFKLHNGKLYLFFNDYYQGKPFNTIIPWNTDERNMINKANTNWKTMNHKS